MSKQKAGGQIVAALLGKFPDAPSLTLARMAYKQHPEAFPNLEAARQMIRYLRGANGRYSRGQVADRTHVRPIRQPGDPFSKIPEGKTHFEQWEAIQFDGPMRVLILSDPHIPYHDRNAILTALGWAKQTGIDTILLNGDTADFFSVSFWEKDPRNRRFAEELKTVKEFLTALREGFPKARIIVKDGNHEERWQRYMFVKAPELLGVPQFEADEILGMRDLDIEPSIGEKRPIRLGHLNVIHGHEYRFAITNPVNPARGLFLRTKAHSLCGHFHQGSHHAETTVEEKNISCWSTGCLCDLHPDYMPLNKWSHGFAFVEVFKDGKFEVRNCFISGGKVY